MQQISNSSPDLDSGNENALGLKMDLKSSALLTVKLKWRVKDAIGG